MIGSERSLLVGKYGARADECNGTYQQLARSPARWQPPKTDPNDSKKTDASVFDVFAVCSS